MCCRTGTYFCMDKSVTAVVIKVRPVPSCNHLQILVSNQRVHRACLMMLTPMLAAAWQGLAEHKDELGAPLCPCRHYDDKQMEAQQGFWNCPCVPMRERKASKHPYCCFQMSPLTTISSWHFRSAPLCF